MRRGLLIAALLCSGCMTRGALMGGMVKKLAGVDTGFFRIRPLLTVDDDGAVHLPPAATLEEEDDSPYMERVLRTYRRQFEPVELGEACDEVENAGPIYVFVHGIGGAGREWVGVIPTLARSEPAALYMYKWFPYDERGVIVQALVDGVQQLARCNPYNPIVVLGHSAGGVLTAFAASRLKLGEPPHPVTLITVAAPLAGVGARPEIEDADDHMQFFNDLGTTHRSYPAASPGVTVLHLRTRYPGDAIMKPSPTGYAPNAISAVVKGSKLVDLPETLGHEDSLLYVARQLALRRLP